MIRRFTSAVIVALVLVGVFAAPRILQAQPSAIYCQLDSAGNFVLIPVGPGGMREAVAACRELGGHPWGIQK